MIEKGATHKAHGQKFKVKGNKVFRWADTEWVLSTTEKNELVPIGKEVKSERRNQYLK